MNVLKMKPTDVVPRGDLVLVRLPKGGTKQVGRLTIPSLRDRFTLGTVVAVGPGSVAAEGGRSDTEDLTPGDTVFIEHQYTGRSKMNPTVPEMQSHGIPLTFDSDPSAKYVLIDQAYINAIFDGTPLPIEDEDDATDPGDIIVG
jgi:co-chaperonin GroES (HSP10)